MIHEGRSFSLLIQSHGMHTMRATPTGTFATWILAAVALSIVPAGQAFSADVLVGKEVSAKNRVPMKSLSHDSWDRLLKKYVDSKGLVNYKAWKASSADRRSLEAYLNKLSTVTTKGSPRETQLAYWINAYNAVTVWGILREYPTSSIRNHTAKLWGYNIWKNLKLRVAGSQLSLEDIEHKILRKAGEPRIHFAIVCASIGCPRLLAEAYTAENLDNQLNENAIDFFADNRKFRWDNNRKSVQLSPILDWFDEDFGKTQAEQLAFCSRFAPEGARALLASGKARVTFLDYDWNLNSQK